MSYCPFAHLIRAFTPEDIEVDYELYTVAKYNRDIKDVFIRELVEDLFDYSSYNSFSEWYDDADDEIIVKLDEFVQNNPAEAEKMKAGLYKYLKVDESSVYVNALDDEYDISVELYVGGTIDLFALYEYLTGKKVPQKYELTKEVSDFDTPAGLKTLYRIKDCRTGKIGGFIESEENLSQVGSCMVLDCAGVWGNACVSGNAIVSDYACVGEEAQVYGNAKVLNEAYIHGSAKVSGNAVIEGVAEILGTSQISGDTTVVDAVVVNSEITNNAFVDILNGTVEDSYISGSVKIKDCTDLLLHQVIMSGSTQMIEISHYDFVDCSFTGQSIITMEWLKAYPTNRLERVHAFDVVKPVSEPKSEPKKVTQDFIYKVNDGSDKLSVKSDIDVDEFFTAPVSSNERENIITIIAIDTKLPLMSIKKQSKDEKIIYKFIVDITTDREETFNVSAIIETQDQLNKLIEQTVEALNSYPQFSKYADNLEECIK